MLCAVVVMHALSVHQHCRLPYGMHACACDATSQPMDVLPQSLQSCLAQASSSNSRHIACRDAAPYCHHVTVGRIMLQSTAVCAHLLPGSRYKHLSKDASARSPRHPPQLCLNVRFRGYPET